MFQYNIQMPQSPEHSLNDSVRALKEWEPGHLFQLPRPQCHDLLYTRTTDETPDWLGINTYMLACMRLYECTLASNHLLWFKW